MRTDLFSLSKVPGFRDNSEAVGGTSRGDNRHPVHKAKASGGLDD